MDRDLLRRNRPAAVGVLGDGLAILAGDALRELVASWACGGRTPDAGRPGDVA